MTDDIRDIYYYVNNFIFNFREELPDELIGKSFNYLEKLNYKNMKFDSFADFQRCELKLLDEGIELTNELKKFFNDNVRY